MTHDFCGIILWAPKVSVHYAMVTAPGAEECVIPGDSTDTSIVAIEGF